MPTQRCYSRSCLVPLSLRAACAIALASGPWIAAASLASVPSASRGCQPQWLSAFADPNDINGSVSALLVFDDSGGGGDALYAGGDFTSAGNAPAARIARWDGASWSPLGLGANNTVRAIASCNDGSGSKLYIGGSFTQAGGGSASRVAMWNGNTWSALGIGMNNTVRTLIVFDDGLGGGPALYAGGDFTTAGGVSARRIARWNGTAWSNLGSGLNSLVYALAVFYDGSGSGPALYVAGSFTTAGGQPANRIARWNGSSWSAVGDGTSDFIQTLAVHDDGQGGGNALYAGGWFLFANGLATSAPHIAKWNGSTWAAVGSGTNAGVSAMAVFDDGSAAGPVLFVGGHFADAGGTPAPRLARWDGSQWFPLNTNLNGVVNALACFDDGSGSGTTLYTGGAFTASPANDVYLARYAGCAPLQPCPADIVPKPHGDGAVTIADILAFIAMFNVPCIACPEDIAPPGGDGFVTIADILEAIAGFGPCP